MHIVLLNRKVHVSPEIASIWWYDTIHVSYRMIQRKWIYALPVSVEFTCAPSSSSPTLSLSIVISKQINFIVREKIASPINFPPIFIAREEITSLAQKRERNRKRKTKAVERGSQDQGREINRKITGIRLIYYLISINLLFCYVICENLLIYYLTYYLHWNR
jgi:hypothetical protein